MKRKKRKKINNQHAKQQQRKQFNWFKRQIQYCLEVIDCAEVMELFDQTTLLAMYDIRLKYVPKMKIAKDVIADAKIKKDLFSDFEFYLTNEQVKVNDQLSMSIKDALQYLLLIDLGVKSKKEETSFNYTRIVEKYFRVVPNFEEVFERGKEELRKVMFVMGVQRSQLNSSICWMREVEPLPGEERKVVFEFKEHIPKKRMIVINRHPRPVYPVCVGISNAGPKEMTIPTESIKLPCTFEGPEIPVFFQNHLLHRFEERLDSIPLNYIQLSFTNNLCKPSFIYFQNRILMEFIVSNNVKLGYVAFEFHKDRLLAKTFLLLSHIGTPEGEKLKEISGMEKQDLSYWAIDRLSTFHNSDLKDHPETRKLFENAGCGDLFKEVSFTYKQVESPHACQAKQMLRYLDGINDAEEQLMAV
jgi:hypothetical protein